MDDFIVRALFAGIGVALIAGPMGCFVVWRRMAYFGDTLSHSALLGVGLGLLLGLNLNLGITLVGLVVALLLLAGQRSRSLSGDTLLGILAHSALALGLVATAFMESVRLDLMAYLFGDILAVNIVDLAWIWGGGAVLLAGLAFLWRPLLLATVHRDLAQVEGVGIARAELGFILLLVLLVAAAVKIVGVLLVTALLIIPAAAARRFARSPEQMAVAAALIGGFAVIAGIVASMRWDTPSGPSIVVAAAALFLIGNLLPARFVKAPR